MRSSTSAAAAAWLGFVLSALVASPLLAQAPPAEVKAGGRAPTLMLGGLLQAQAEAGDRGDSRFSSANDRIYLRRARLNATGKFLEEFDFKLEVELAGSLAEASNLRAQLTDGYINWNRYPAAQVRLGQFKTPFGHEQLYADPKLPTIERSLANDRLTAGRQIGFQVGGDLYDKRFSYAVGLFNGNGTNTTANDNDRFATFGRVSAQVFRGPHFGKEGTLAFGVGAYSSEDSAVTLAGFGFDSTPATPDRDNIFTGKRDGREYDLQLKAPGARFEIWAEWLEGHFEPLNGRPRAAVDAEGYALQAAHFLKANKLELVLRHEFFDPSVSAADNETTIDTLGLNYFLKGHDLKAMLNLLQVDDQLQPATATRVLLRLQVIF